MSEKYHRVVGIDLGTTYSAVASYNSFAMEAEILVDRDNGNQKATPSVIWFDRNSGKVIVGTAAKRSILTEPDPRDDLSGRDVARKLVLLAREMGLDAEPSDAIVESLIPKALQDLSIDDFLEQLPVLDADWKARCASASGPSQYVARLDSDGAIHAGVETVSDDSSFTRLKGSSLAVAFNTKRYSPDPLVIRGPGASADITAAVLLADVVRAAEAMH